MNSAFQKPKCRRIAGMISLLLGAFLVIALAGCTGIPTSGEKEARERLADVKAAYRTGSEPDVTALGANSTLGDFLAFAIQNNPSAKAAFYDYAASVERITIERSLPDPRLTLELDFQDVVMSVMPGLMAEVPWVKKLRLNADVATNESEAKYHAFSSAVLKAAFEVKQAYYKLYFLEDRIRVTKNTAQLLEEFEQNARAQSESGKATLQDVLRAQIESERLRTELENLQDSRGALLAQFKAALGLGFDKPAPPLPGKFESTPLSLPSEDLLSQALSRNPRLKQMEAEVRSAETGIHLAHMSKLPDFSLGAEADLKASPTLWRPSVGITLPIWRDKIAAQIMAAQASKSAARERLSAEQIQLAVDFADKAFTYREATRNIELLSKSLLPKAKQALDIARASYSAGRTDFINLLDAERTLLDFELAEVEARTQRELALAGLSLLVAGNPPEGAPALSLQQRKP